MAAINKNFVIKNGVEIGDNLIYGDKDNLKVGIGTTVPGYTLDVRGGIGVTDITASGTVTANSGIFTSLSATSPNFESITFRSGIGTELSISGVTTTTNLNVVGIATFDQNVNVVGLITTRDLNVVGIATVETLDVQTKFDVYDSQAVFHNDVYIAGNLSIGGTGVSIVVTDLRVTDRDIILGVTTDSFGNDISNDTTANHGGIAIASTEGNPLVSLQAIGINTFPDTYKQLMWVRSDTFGIGTTDAWLFNYGVGIGSTQVPNGVRFAVTNALQVTDNTITTPNVVSTNSITANSIQIGSSLTVTSGIVTNLNVSGITTTGSLNVSGFGTIGNIAFRSTGSSGGIITSTDNVGIITYYGDGSQLSGVGGAPGGAGADTQVIFNSSGSFAASSQLTFVDPNLTVGGGLTASSVKTTDLNVSGVSTFIGNVNIDSVSTELSNIVNIRKSAGGNVTASFDSGGQATLYYDGSQKIQTQTNGVVVNGRLTVQANGEIFAGSLDLDSVSGGSGNIKATSGISTFGFVTGTSLILSGIATAQDFDSLSDFRYKTDINTVSDALFKVSELRGVRFNWKESGLPSYGVVAQELEQVLPELVHGHDPKTVNYNGIIGVLIEAIKDLKEEISTLKDKIDK